MSPIYNTPARGPSTKKKALLVGIGHNRYKGGGLCGAVPRAVSNVKKIATFLREHCGYTGIIVMTDEDGVEERYRPTEINLRREIEALGRGVEPGNRLVFYFAGHVGEVFCKTDYKRDGKHVGGQPWSSHLAIVTVDGLKIKDNELHDKLVKPLPKGSALTAIFDSCTSGTLLDLDHYECNNVYRPWVNKGGRRTKTLRNIVVRKNCDSPRSDPPSRRRSTFWKGSGEADACFPSLTQLTRGSDVRSIAELAQLAKEQHKHYGGRCASPERQFKCEGWCRKTMPESATLDHPDVISISSSNDGQISWDASTRNGDSISMTTFLIDILEKHPQITFSELMTLLNHSVHSFTRKMHDNVRWMRRARRKAGKNAGSEDSEPEEESKGEMDNFQDLQLGSITPVDMDRLFVL